MGLNSRPPRNLTALYGYFQAKPLPANHQRPQKCRAIQLSAAFSNKNQLICKAGAPKQQPKHCVVDPTFSYIKVAHTWRNVAPELAEWHMGTTPALWIAKGMWMPLSRQDEGSLLCPRPACYPSDKFTLLALWVRISPC